MTIAKALHLHESELKKAWILFSLQLTTGIGLAFLLIISSTLLLGSGHKELLLAAFLLSGLSVPLVQKWYHKSEIKYGIWKEFKYILIIAVLITSFLLLLGLQWQHWVFYLVLFVWYQVLYFLIQTCFWGVAAGIFNIRESKRIFNFIGSGDIPSKLLGYSLVAVATYLMPLYYILSISILAFIAAFLIYLRYSIEMELGKHHPAAHKDMPVHNQPSWQHPLLKSIVILAVFYSISFTLIDITFLIKVKSAFYDDASLAAFLAMFLAISRVVSLLVKVLISYKIQQKLGLKGTLMALPVLAGIGGLVILSIGPLGGTEFFLYGFGILMVMAEMVKSVIYEPYYFSLFQPLLPELRLTGHRLAKGVMIPVGQMVAALILAVSVFVLPVDIIIWSCLSLIVISIGWTLWVSKVFIDYYTTIKNGIKNNRFFQVALDNILSLDDSYQILIEKIRRGDTRETLLALEYLKLGNEETFRKVALECIESETRPEVLLWLVRRLKEKPSESALIHIHHILLTDPDSAAPELIQYVCQWKPESLELWIESFDPVSARNQYIGALAGSFHSEDLNAMVIAGNRLLNLLHSQEESQIVLGMDCIIASGQPLLHKQLIPFTDLRYKKLHAQLLKKLAHYHHESFLPFILSCISDPSLSAQAINTLKYYDRYFNGYSTQIIEILGYGQWMDLLCSSHSTFAADWVESQISMGKIDAQAIEFLYKMRRICQSQSLLLRYFDSILQDIASISNLISATDNIHVLNALYEENHHRMILALKVRYLLSPKKELEKVIYALEKRRAEDFPFTVELLELMSKKYPEFKMVFRLFEINLLRKFHYKRDKEECDRIIFSKNLQFNPWTVALYLYTGEYRITDFVGDFSNQQIINQIIE